jgi:hypothetical protein
MSANGRGKEHPGQTGWRELPSPWVDKTQGLIQVTYMCPKDMQYL